MNWRLVFTAQARCKETSRSGLRPSAEKILLLLARNPHQNRPPYERPVGELSSACSRRINIQHRVVYQVIDDSHVVKILRL